MVLSSIILAWEVSRAYFLLLAIFSCWFYIKNYQPPNRDQLIFCLPIVFFFVTATISHLANDSPHRGPQYLIETYLLLVLAVPMIFLYSSRAPALKFIWGMFIVASIAAGLMSLVEYLISPQVRAGGSTGQPVLFATMALSLVAVAGASYRHYLKSSLPNLILWLCALILGLIAVYLSGTRGAWIAFPALSIALLLFHLENSSKTKNLTVMLIILVIVPLVIYQFPLHKNRIDTGIDMASQLITEGYDPAQKRNSFSIRYELWQAALQIFNENVAFGVGPGNYRPAMKQYVNEHNASPRLPNLKHAHNQMSSTLMTKGLIGALALVLMIGAHFYLCVKYLKKDRPPDVRALALAASTILITFVFLGLSSSPLETKITLVFYGFSLAELKRKIISSPSSDGAGSCTARASRGSGVRGGHARAR